MGPDSDEGRALLNEARVELIAPGSRSLGRVRLADAVESLRRRLEKRLGDSEIDFDRTALQEGLRRLDERARGKEPS